jgi:hypothetical protein
MPGQQLGRFGRYRPEGGADRRPICNSAVVQLSADYYPQAGRRRPISLSGLAVPSRDPKRNVLEGFYGSSGRSPGAMCMSSGEPNESVPLSVASAPLPE